MTTARRETVDHSITRWYHCVSNCVRSALLMSDEAVNDRKQWIEDRLKVLANHFAVSVGGFAVMDNHFHVLCRFDPDVANTWSAAKVVRRWFSIYPPRNFDLDDSEIVDYPPISCRPV